MTEPTEWLPHKYQDESCPPTRRSPSAWVTKNSDGAWAIADGDHMEGVDALWTLTEGDVILFDYRVDLGSGDLVVDRDEDGGFAWHTTFTSGAKAPPGTELSVWNYEEGNLWPSLDEAAHDLIDGTHQVAVYAWSHPPIPFRFTEGRFERVRQDA